MSAVDREAADQHYSYLPPFTYFKDDEGYIYYSSSDNYLENEQIRAILVYTPAPLENADRYQPATKSSYRKFISHGYRSEVPRMSNALSRNSFTHVAQFMDSDPSTGDEFLSVPTSSIAEIYEPKATLRKILSDGIEGLSSASIDKLQAAVDAFQNVGLSLGRLGLYGGLQCEIKHVGTSEINDVDLLVDGCDAYDAVKYLSSSNKVRPETFPKFIAENAVKRAVAIRRGQVSQFRLLNFPDTTVDIRLVRSVEMGYSFAQLKLGEIDLNNVEVLSASESLSLPARYKIVDEHERTFDICSQHYHHIGAATVGDEVTVRGITSGEGQILLTKPDAHYIYSPASIEY